MLLGMFLLLPLAGQGQVTTVSFQEGDANGYMGTQDTEVRGSAPDTDVGQAVSINPDNEDGGFPVQGLIRFDNIFGLGPNQIPPGETIIQATLSIRAFDPGNDVDYHRMLIPWDESSTWNSLTNVSVGGGVQDDDVEAASAITGTIRPNPAPAIYTVNITADVQAWSNGDPNYGWVQINTGLSGSGGGLDYDSSEALIQTNRPILIVSYGTATAPTDATGGTLPADATVLEGRSHTLNAAFDGVPTPEIRWFLNDLEITGETGNSYTITNMTAANGGVYYAWASNSVGVVESRRATITFLSDTEGPVFLPPLIIQDDHTFLVSYNEPLKEGFEYFNVEVYDPTIPGNPFDTQLGTTSGYLTNETNYVLFADKQPEAGVVYHYNHYSFTVQDPYDNYDDIDWLDEVAVNLIAGPELVSGTLESDGTIILTFNEPMTEAGAILGDISVYLTGGDPVGGNLGVDNVAPGPNPEDLVLTTTTATTPGSDYSVRVLAGSVSDANTNPSETDFSIDLLTSFSLIALGSDWRYLDDGSNQDLTDWKSIGFDDSSWKNGAAELGYGDGDEVTIVLFGPDPDNANNDPSMKYTTTYFRHTFNIADASGISSLEAALTYDDGAVVYLNGTEVTNININVPTTYTSFALGAGDYTPWVFPIDPSLLVNGANVIAVEMHQGNLTSSDISMDLSLSGEGSLPGEAPVFTSQPIISPASPVDEGAAASITVVVTGTPAPAIRWQFDDGSGFVDIAGPAGAGSTLNINPMTGADVGSYRAVASNSAGSVTSSSVALAMTPDAIAPTLDSGLVQVDGTILLGFSEDIGNAGSYTVQLVGGGGAIAVNSAVVNGSQVTLTLASALGSGVYEVIVTDATDNNFNLNVIDPNPSTLVLNDRQLLAAGSDWSYLDDGSDQGSAWKEVGFVQTWMSGPAELGYGDAPATMISFGTDSANKHITYYFLQTINVPDPSAFAYVTIGLVRDDGAVVYVNGTEVRRDKLPPGPVAYDTLAEDPAVGGADESTFFESTHDSSIFTAGSNVIAVEVHQQSPSSSDLSFNMEITGSSSGGVPGTISAEVDSSGDVILSWTGVGNLYVQEASALADPASATVWTTITSPVGPHTSPLNVGAATGSRYFRLTDTP